MKERPILFSAPMVRALLAGTKSQTRRVCKSQPYANGFKFDGHDILCHNDYLPPSAMLMDVKRGPHRYSTSDVEGWEVECPYGLPGDRLWVREAHAPRADCLVSWQRSMTESFNRTQPGDICYRADESARDWVEKWRPSIHMPRWASRITLEVTEVRVERLQDISEADAVAEGIEQLASPHADVALYRDYAPGHDSTVSPVHSYETLWDSINGSGAWAANPYVWAVSFRRIETQAA